jgi:hypothetical protein
MLILAESREEAGFRGWIRIVCCLLSPGWCHRSACRCAVAAVSSAAKAYDAAGEKGENQADEDEPKA